MPMKVQTYAVNAEGWKQTRYETRKSAASAAVLAMRWMDESFPEVAIITPDECRHTIETFRQHYLSRVSSSA